MTCLLAKAWPSLPLSLSLCLHHSAFLNVSGDLIGSILLCQLSDISCLRTSEAGRKGSMRGECTRGPSSLMVKGGGRPGGQAFIVITPTLR